MMLGMKDEDLFKESAEEEAEGTRYYISWWWIGLGGIVIIVAGVFLLA